MNILRALFLGAVLWILVFIEISIMTIGYNLSYGDPVYNSLHFLFLSMFVIILAISYFNMHNSKKGFLNGILLGIIFILVMIFIDAIVTVPMFQNQDYSFLIRSDILLGEIWIILLSGLVGFIKHENVHLRRQVIHHQRN